MQLTPSELIELNAELSSPKLDLPVFRREVTKTGANYEWLRKHILTRNAKKVTKRTLELLKL